MLVLLSLLCLVLPFDLQADLASNWDNFQVQLQPHSLPLPPLDIYAQVEDLHLIVSDQILLEDGRALDCSTPLLPHSPPAHPRPEYELSRE